MSRFKLCTVAYFFVALVAPLAAADNATRTKAHAEQQKQITVLLGNVPSAEKAAACKRLAIIGDSEAVPALAALLPDAKLSSWARIALEVIPGPAADEALRAASGTLHGRLLVGVINSLGVRRDPKAVDLLIGRLRDHDNDVAAAAAVALGHIGGERAVAAVRQAVASGPKEVRAAAAEGTILFAERFLAAGNAAEATKLYDEVRAADLPKQLVLDATRGAILARGSAGVPLLIEQLRSSDKQHFNLGLSLARELPGRQTTEAIAAEIGRAVPQRQALLVLALADRKDPAVVPVIVKAARGGSPAVRALALSALRRVDEPIAAPVLLDAALDPSAAVSEAALSVIDDFQGDAIDRLISQRLANERGRGLLLLIELAGRRHVAAATPALWKAADDSDLGVRAAAIAALGGTVTFADLPRLVARLASASTAESSTATKRALQAALQRMPDREACAALVAGKMSGQSPSVQCRLLEVLGSIGGGKALAVVAAAARGNDERFRDTAFRLLGQWMSLDAAPVLLDLAQNAGTEKYQVRAARAYIRLARQFDMPPGQRAEMCRQALKIARRPEDKRLVLEVLLRYPSPQMHELAIDAAKTPELKDEAEQVDLAILGARGSDTKELRKALAQAGHQTVKLEIVRAEYGEGTHTKDVTATVRQCAGHSRVLFLPSSNYNEAFGGDPSPNVVKQLTIRYRVNGQPGEVILAENATIVLPMPK